MSEVQPQQAQENEAMDLIVVGTPVGGIEVLSILVSTFSQDFPAPIILAQHLLPNYPSNLDTMLRSRSSLPIEMVTSSAILQKGRIYIVPSNRSVHISDHLVEIDIEDEQQPYSSFDRLLSTTAAVYGEHLIAVILTATGSDGAIGAVDVKNAGGVVIVQSLRTGHYPSMPLALPPTAVDFEVELEQIGPLLYDLLLGANILQPEEPTPNSLQHILERVGQQANLDFRQYQTSTIARRIGQRIILTRNQSIDDYIVYLNNHPEEITELIKAFLLNVTQFFRGAEAFAYLKEYILPRLIKQANGRDRVLRFWTAGCATGEEPYSLAMLLTDLLGAELPQWSIKIFATDLDDAAINFARRGFYAENMLKNVPTEYRERFFEREEQGLRIAKTLRQMVIFGQQDLSRSAPFPRIDLVLCRNVLIYFTHEFQHHMLNQFAFSLSPHGYLLLGEFEMVRPTQTFYELVDSQWKVYRCVGNALPSARRQTLAEMNVQRPENQLALRSPRQRSRSTQGPPNPSFEIGQLRRFNEVMLRFLPIGVVVIDRSYHILTASGLARRLFNLRETGGEQDFLHSVRGLPYHEMRAAIDTLFREHNPLSLPEIELSAMNGGNGRFISLALTLMQFDTSLPEQAMISVTDVTQQVLTRQQLVTVQKEQIQLMNELGEANKRLSDANKELMDANEELQVANEELVLTHEELQASIEEFETTNEELQATNEELETNNEELQATNEEFETTNDELRARSGELQELTMILDTERGRLAQMVELAPFYILVLRGPSLTVEAFNPRYARLLEKQPVLSRPLDEVIDLFWENGIEIVHLARDVYRLDMIQSTHQMQTHLVSHQPTGIAHDSYFSYTVVPSHDPLGKVDGVIIYAMDETEARLREVEQERERLQMIFDNFAPAALALFDAQTSKLLIGSPRYREAAVQATGFTQEQLFERTWPELCFLPSAQEAVNNWRQVTEQLQQVRFTEFPYTFPDHTLVIWDYTLAPLIDVEVPGRTRYILFTLVDATAQVQARQKMEQLDNLKDEFLALATHELRTPLTSLKGNSQLLQRILQRRERGLTKPDDLQQETTLIERVLSQIDHINRMISEMFDAARIRGQAFELHINEPINLIMLTQHIIDSYNSLNRTIALQMDGEHIIGHYDPDRLQQVIQNLLNNALKYSPKTKPVTVTIQRLPAEVLFAIKDEGQGIAAEDLEHIFDRFYRSDHSRNGKSDGLGLGLYISHEIIVQHGGRMWCESEPEKGSSFFFTLPLQPFE